MSNGPLDFDRASNLGLREAAQITALIIDLHRIDQLIDADIAREQEEAGLFDLPTPTIMAQTLKVRRNNLAQTIASLEARLASLWERPEAAVPRRR